MEVQVEFQVEELEDTNWWGLIGEAVSLGGGVRITQT